MTHAIVEAVVGKRIFEGALLTNNQVNIHVAKNVTRMANLSGLSRSINIILCQNILDSVRISCKAHPDSAKKYVVSIFVKYAFSTRDVTPRYDACSKVSTHRTTTIGLRLYVLLDGCQILTGRVVFFFFRFFTVNSYGRLLKVWS